jgi:hypothetical protein
MDLIDVGFMLFCKKSGSNETNTILCEQESRTRVNQILNSSVSRFLLGYNPKIDLL